MSKTIGQNVLLLEAIQKEKQRRELIEKIGDRATEPNLLGISKALDEYYFTNKLRLYCAFLSYKNIMKGSHLHYDITDLLLVKEIILWIEQQSQISATLKIFNQIRILFEQLNDSSKNLKPLFDSTLELIKKNEESFSNEENLEMYSFLNNFSIKKMNEGFKHYRPIFLWLNNQIINIKWSYKKPQRLSPVLFRNIVAVALSINDISVFTELKTHGLQPDSPFNSFREKYDWVEKFIDYYGERLEENSEAKAYLQYCKALLEFDRKTFSKAYKIFNNTLRQQGTFLNLDLKVLHLKILYEVNIRKAAILEYDKIEIRKVLDAYRQLLKYKPARKYQITYQLHYYKTFEKLFKKLFKFYMDFEGRLDNSKNPKFLSKKEEIIHSIKKNGFPFNQWFLEKIEQIK